MRIFFDEQKQSVQLTIQPQHSLSFERGAFAFLDDDLTPPGVTLESTPDFRHYFTDSFLSSLIWKSLLRIKDRKFAVTFFIRALKWQFLLFMLLSFFISLRSTPYEKHEKIEEPVEEDLIDFVQSTLMATKIHIRKNLFYSGESPCVGNSPCYGVIPLNDGRTEDTAAERDFFVLIAADKLAHIKSGGSFESLMLGKCGVETVFKFPSTADALVFERTYREKKSAGALPFKIIPTESQVTAAEVCDAFSAKNNASLLAK